MGFIAGPPARRVRVAGRADVSAANVVRRVVVVVEKSMMTVVWLCLMMVVWCDARVKSLQGVEKTRFIYRSNVCSFVFSTSYPGGRGSSYFVPCWWLVGRMRFQG